MSKDKIGWGAAGCGALLALACFASFLFWAFNVWVELGGVISVDEAFPGVFGSCCCGFFSIAILAGGAFFAMKVKKDAASPET